MITIINIMIVSTLKANDPERQSLVNELETYKNVAKKMKSKIK